MLLRQNIDTFLPRYKEFDHKIKRINYIEEVSIKSYAKNLLQDIKKLLWPCGQLSCHDYRILLNDYEWNFDVIMSKCST